MTTKLDLQAVYIPQRIADDLENIKIYPLTVIAAPSGFGKTTVLEAFFAQKCFESARVVRHTFFDCDANEYWSKFCSRLAQTDKICAEALANCGTPCGANLSDICEIMSDIECDNELYIVLDNLSDTADGLDMLLVALASHRAPKMHIVASVCSVGSVGNIDLGGRVHCIDAKSLSFTPDDCRAYFECVGQVLTESELTELVSLTGGWVFAVYLQMLFYAKHARFEKGIPENLIEKAFFDRLSDEEKKFCILLSLFDSFSAEKAVQVSGESTAFVRKMLSGGFVHRDDKCGEYWFHSLIRAYLQTEFAHLSKDERDRMCYAAAQWEDKYGENITAIRLYYAAGAYENIFAMRHTSYDLSDIGDANTRQMIFDILDKTPHSVKLRYPESMVPLAFILFFVNEYEKLGETIEEIFALVAECDLTDEMKNEIIGETELLISFTEFNDIAKMSARHRRAYELLGGKARLINMRSTWTFGSPSVMCLYHSCPGRLDDELRLMDKCMPYYYRLTGGHGMGSEYAMRAEAELLRGNCAAAETLAHRAMFESQSKNQSSVYQCGLFSLACIAVLRGDDVSLSDVIIAMTESAVQNSEDMCRHSLSLFLGYIYAFTGRTDKVALWLVNGDINENMVAPMTMPFAHIVYARVLLERGEYAKLLAFCPFACGVAAQMPSILPQIYFHIFATCAHSAIGSDGAAVDELNAALELAVPDGIYLPFAECFSALKPILKKSDITSYGEITALGTDYERSSERLLSCKPRLSPREREVAQLICEGLTNKQIAARLFVSLSTVKLTVSNIFEKTGIRSRAQLTDMRI